MLRSALLVTNKRGLLNRRSVKVEALLELIKHMHDEYGDGYHDGTDFAIDYAIEQLRQVGYLPQLPQNWQDEVR